MSELVLRDVTKAFGDVLAVKDVSLKVGHRNLVVIVGPSGCGKTTLLRLIAGFEKPDSGEIYIDGQLVNLLGPYERRVQMVFQSLALWPHMKVFDSDSYTNLSFGLKIKNLLRREILQKVDDISSRVGMERRLFTRYPISLSAGEKQRVAVARSLTTAPSILLMDEPLSNLDVVSRTRMREELKRWHRSMSFTTIYVTHNLLEAFFLADQLAVMNAGRIIQYGSPREVYTNPANSFVEEFIHAFELPKFT